MWKRMSDEEFDKLMEEQFMKEADAIEKALFSDDSEEANCAYTEELSEESRKKKQAAYEDLVERLKADGEYREDKIISISQKKHKEAVEKISDNSRFHKVVNIAGVISICTIGVFSASMTSEANRQYFIETVRYFTGNDARLMVDNVKNKEKSIDADEYNAVQEIELQVGLDMPTLHYRPEGFQFYNYEIVDANGLALMEYKFQDMIATLYVQKKSNISDSTNFDFHGEKLETTTLNVGQISMDVFEVQDKDELLPNYIAQWEKEEVFYQFSGRMEKEEFLKIITNILF